MELTPREKDKLLIALAAMVARRRLERGVKLNFPEAVALITDTVVEGARDGRSVADLMEAGAHVLTPEQVSPVESFAIYFPMVLRDDTVLRLHWGTTAVSLRIKAPFKPPA